MKKGCKESGKSLKKSNSAENVRVSVPASEIPSVTQMATYLQKRNKVVNYPRKDTSKPVTEPNFSQVEFDVVRGLKVDEKWISFDGRKGNRERSYAEAVTGNIVHGGKNIISGQNQFNTSSNLRDNSTLEVSSKAENKIEEKLFTIDDKWVTNERSRRKCKRSKWHG